jgi:hypothetical protein
MAMLESISDPEVGRREHAAAVAAIEAEMFGGASPEAAPRGMALEGLFTPASDHYNRNYLRLTCAQVRDALLS